MDRDTLSIQATERLFSLFENKLHLLTELKSLALDQADLVSKQEMASLMPLLSRKQAIMETLQQVQRELAHFKDDDPESRCWISSDRRRECQELVKRCEQSVRELIQQENQSISEMTSQRESIQSQLIQNAAASQVQKAYSSASIDDLESDSGFVIEG